MTGATIYAAKSAWAQGAGAVQIICPRGLMNLYDYHLPEMVKVGIGSEKDTELGYDHTPEILSALSKKDGLCVVGPGLGRTEQAMKLTQCLLEEYRGVCCDRCWRQNSQPLPRLLAIFFQWRAHHNGSCPNPSL